LSDDGGGIQLIVGDQPKFCDTHSFNDLPRPPREVSYTDLEIAEAWYGVQNG